MKSIIQGNINVIKLLGKQRLKDSEYRQMKYVLQDECEDGTLLHNSITGQMVLLSPEEADFLKHLPSIKKEIANALVEAYFLVPVDYDEQITVDKLRILMKKVFPKEGISGYTILTTTNCNARCFYCYQADYPHINMSEDLAKRLVDYMEDHKGSGTLHLSWFGGEPLMGIKRIDQICMDLEGRGIKFSSNMISNGYLFDEEIVARAVNLWKLKSIQITLDGPENVYNSTKAYVSSTVSPYQRVLKNIDLLLRNKVRVAIRLNLDQHNIDDLRDLVDDLYQKIGKQDLFEVYSHILFNDEGYKPIQRNKDEENKLYEYQNELSAYMERLGLARHHLLLPSLKVYSCMADNESTVVVFPDGRFFKCEHTAIGDEFGHLDRGVEREENIDKFKQLARMDKCKNCPIYPSCMPLKECNGLDNYNRFTCGYNVSSRRRALTLKYRERKGSTEKNSEISKKDIKRLFEDEKTC